MHQMKYSSITFDVPIREELIAAKLESNRVPLSRMAQAEPIRDALAHPIGTGTLDTVVKAGETVCIVIPGTTRKWQSPAVYVPILVEALNACGVLDEDTRQDIFAAPAVACEEVVDHSARQNQLVACHRAR